MVGAMLDILKKIIRDPGFPEEAAWRRYGFKPNQLIVREGDDGGSLYLVERGGLRVTGRVEVEDNRYVQPGICDLQAGDLFGEFCLFQPKQRSASVTALSEGQLLEIDGSRLGQYLDKHPETGYLVLKALFLTLNDRLGRANQRVESLFAWGLKAHGIDQYL